MNSNVQLVVAGVVSIALIAAVAVLTWHGSIDGQAAVSFFSGIGVGGLAVGVHAAGVKSGVNAAMNAPAPPS